MQQTKLSRNTFLLLSVLGCAAVSAQPAQEAAREVEQAIHLSPDIENGKKVYLVCAVCHTPEGWGTADGRYPQIAGQLSSVIIKQLADIRARNRDNPTMRPFTSPQLLGGTQEIADVAAYIEQLPMNPQNGTGSGMDLERGEKLYRENCVDCHGDQGQGNSEEHIPLVYGQHYNYLMRQFDWIRIGKRRNADREMMDQIHDFSLRDQSAVLDYVSRLSPPAERLGEVGWQNPDFPGYSRKPVMQGPPSFRPPLPPPVYPGPRMPAPVGQQ